MPGPGLLDAFSGYPDVPTMPPDYFGISSQGNFGGDSGLAPQARINQAFGLLNGPPVASSPDVMAPTTQQGDASVPLPKPRPPEAPGGNVVGGGDTTPAQAPMPFAPSTPPSSPNVPDTSLAGRIGLGDRLAAAFHGFANSPGRGLLGHLSGAATGFETGQRQDAPGLALQSRQALYQAAKQAGATNEQALSYSLAPQQTGGVLPKPSMQEDWLGNKQPMVTNPFTGAVAKAPAGVPPNVAGQPEAFQRQYFMTSKNVPNGARYYDPETKRTMVRMGDRVIWADSGKPVQ